MTPARFPHSDTPGSTLGCQLPRAYRRLLRPSSALDAKASTTCPSQLVTHTTNPTPTQTGRDQTGDAHTSQKHDMPQRTNTPATITTGMPQQTKQSDPPHTHQKAWAYTGLKDARVHYPDLKQQPHTTPNPPPQGQADAAGTCSLVPKPQTPRHRPPCSTRRPTGH